MGRLWTTQAMHVCWAADGESKSIVHHSYELASTVKDACSVARVFESLRCRTRLHDLARGDTQMLPVLCARRLQFLMDGVANHGVMVTTTSTGANPCMCR